MDFLSSLVQNPFTFRQSYEYYCKNYIVDRLITQIVSYLKNSCQSQIQEILFSAEILSISILYINITEVMSPFVLILILIHCFHINSTLFTKQTNNADTQAICLNGAQSFLYFPSSPPPNIEGIMIHFMPTPTPLFCGGNSLSTTLDNCITVSNQVTSYWNSHLNITSGILADPSFDNWLKIIIPSCDGAMFQGFSTNATKYKGKDLYFRGNKIVKSNLDLIPKKYNLTKINKFVFTGSGFGAAGALIWSRYFHDEIVLNLGQNKQFSLILDSIPFGYNSFKTSKDQYQNSLENMVQVANSQEINPFILCTLRNQGFEERCFKIQESYYYLNFPVMVIDSQYDSTYIERILEIDCVNKQSGSLDRCSQPQRNFIEGYRSNKLKKLYYFMNFKDNSIWTISCSSSSFLIGSKYNNPSWFISQSLQEAVQSFIARRRVTDINNYPWPDNLQCSGKQ